MKVVKVAPKVFVGQRPVRVAIFRKDEDLIYSVIYRDGRDDPVLPSGSASEVTRDKEYDLTPGKKGTRVFYFAVHRTEEESAAQMLIVHLKPALRLRNVSRPFHFGEVGVKGRGSRGNIVTKLTVERIARAPKDFDPEVGA